MKKTLLAIYYTLALSTAFSQSFLSQQLNWVSLEEISWCEPNNTLEATYVNSYWKYGMEGSSCICDNNCNIIFFSAGTRLYCSDLLNPPNGYQLLGNVSSSQSSIFIPKPLDSNSIYLFTVDANNGSGGLAYNRIDRTLNGGLGDIVSTEKNIQLFAQSLERITSVKHANDTNIWVITHPDNSGDYYAFLITSSGVDTANPVISTIGQFYSDANWGDCRGYMKASPHGNKLAVASEGMNYFELFDFNNSTGVISNQVLLSGANPGQTDDAYGLEFSPDEHYLYGTSRWDGKIYQWDISLSSSAAIINSFQTVVDLSYGNNFGALQMGPDGYIYVAIGNENFLSRITDPSMLSGNIGFQYNAIQFPNSFSYGEGLPNFISGPVTTQTTSVDEEITEITCNGANDGKIKIISQNGVPPFTFVWNTGQTIDSISNLAPGTYSYTTTDALGNSVSNSIILNNPPAFGFTNTISNISCFGLNDGNINVNLTGGVPPYTFNWNNGSTSANLLNLQAGTYQFTINDSHSCILTDSIEITQPDSITVSANILNMSCPSCFDGEINLTISGGTSPYSFNWNTGNSTQNLTSLYSGIYSVTISDVNNCQKTDSFEISGYAPNWNYSLTSNNHTILIQDTCQINLGGYPIEYGDYIGVFFDSLGSLACGGYTKWTGTTTSISAWGADTGNDGFQIAEIFKWKIWDASEDTVYNASATYMPVPPMTDQEYFAINGLSGIESFSTISSQSIMMSTGWSLFSTYILPQNQQTNIVCNSILQNMVIMKNNSGQIFWPEFNINSIGNMSIYEGYQIKMTNTATLHVEGLALLPDTTNIALQTGWSIIPYLRINPASISSVLISIQNEIIIVKDELGNIYWQYYGINSIGDLYPGKAYRIKLNGPSTLIYPANNAF